MQQLTISDWLGQDTWSGKTSPEPSAQTEEKTFKPYSPKSFESQNQKPLMCLCLRKTSGHTPESYTMRWEDGQLPGGLTTLNTGECPNAGKESLFCLMGGVLRQQKSCLSNILETNPDPKYNLSPTACQGILNRAERRGKTLPQQLEKALIIQANGGGTLSFQERAGKPGGGKGILIQNERTGALSTLNNQAVLDTDDGLSVCAGFSTEPSAKSRSIGYEEEKSPTLRAGVVPATVFENHCQDSRYKALGDTCSTLATNLGTGGNNQPLVVKEPILLESNQNHATVQENGISTALPASMGMGGGYIPMITEPVCIGNGQADQAKESELVGALNCMHDQQAVLTYGVDLYNQTQAEEIAKTLNAVKTDSDHVTCTYGLDRASFNQGQNAQYNFDIREEQAQTLVSKGLGAVKEPHSCVRRLTPLECERLQGFPDNWTDIGEWTDSKGKKHKEADAPRYKALGNSIAIPFWFWLLKRISAEYTRRATLGSLFDGIGGFPLCWEAVNGKGTARWASEIEEFPIAVTKKHFPE